ncbi:poly(A) RNA polymerase gld-2 homolog B-like isoform X2 [Eurosta solidaginis]|uniref:poly(A) RNA polymerase gld-2 homolog B-like isoform X2 n=1 Tax=Eurosta solidaginis TaxID=178769 RepID=UPI0035311B8E
MKVLAQITNGKSQQHSNNIDVVKDSSLSNTITKTQTGQHEVVNKAKERPETKYLQENRCKNNDKYNMKSQETPKQYNLNNNKNGKKPNSHKYCNIPTTTNVSNRNKYYQQQHHRYNQQQHNFLNDSQDNKYKYIITQNNCKSVKSDVASPNDIRITSKLNQKLSNTSLINVDDFVNNNIIPLDINNISKDDSNSLDHIIDKNIVPISSHSVKSEFEKYLPPPLSLKNTGESLVITSDTLPQHNCVGENSTINLDCHSCWVNLVTPQSINQLQAAWSSTRYKRSSVSSTSSTQSSTESTSILPLAESNSEVLNNTSVNERESNVSQNNSIKKKLFRKGNIDCNRRSTTEQQNGCSSSRVKEHLQGTPNKKSPTPDGIQNIKHSSQDSACRASTITENQGKDKKTTMTTALKRTVLSTAATTSTIDSTATKTTIVAENVNTLSEGPSSNTAASLSSQTLPNEIVLKEEFSTLLLTSRDKSASPNNPKTTSASLSSTFLASASASTTPSTSVSPNSYSLDFLHSVGEQMNCGANLSAFPKSSIPSMRTTTLSHENTSTGSPSRNSYQNVGPNRQLSLSNRYMPNVGGVGMVNNNNSIHSREQRSHRFQQYHHQPHPLTLGAFMQKELIHGNFISAGSSGGGGNNRGSNNAHNNINGSDDSGIPDINNNNADYTNQQSYRNHQRYHNYYQSHYQSHQRLPPIQRAYTNTQASYPINGSSSNITHYCKYHNTYQSQQNNGDPTSNNLYHSNHNSLLQEDDNSGFGNEDGANGTLSGANTNSNATNINFRSSKQPQQKLSNTKKSNYVSSSMLSCSSSSTSSASSNCSQASTTSYRQQKMKSSSQMNLTIETLPRKTNSSSTHRNHRLQQCNYQNPHHTLLQFSTGTCAPHSSTAQQLHQNIHNLKYVNTETLTNGGMSGTSQSRNCSPTLPMSCTSGPHDEISTSMIQAYTPNNFHSRPHQYQQNYIHGKRSAAPFPSNVCSTHATASLSTSPIPAGNIICYTPQLNDSAASCDSSQSTNIAHGTVSPDYDDSDSSSTNSVRFSQQSRSMQQSNSVSLSSSSSTSSIPSSTAILNYNVSHQQGMSMVALPHMKSPDHTGFTYNTAFGSTSQHFTPQTQPLASPQQQPTQFRNNGIISMFNVSLSKNCIDDELNSLKQSSTKQGIRHQQRHFYVTSGEHLNANSGYWSPLQHTNFLYPQSANIMPAAPCSTPKATLPPCLSDHDDHHHLHPHLNQQQLNIMNNQSETISLVSHAKRSSTPQIGSATMSQQLQHHGLAQSTVTTAPAAVVSFRQRNCGRTQQSQMAVPPPPTSISHVYTQHNLLFGGPQTHIRSSVNASHEFFTHTPPDRFLARAHLIEAKETPNTLLNKSKWDNLSLSIWNKFINSQQTEETFKQKMRLWRYLYIIIKNTYPRFGLYLVGSTISGFGADTSDVDMCLVSRSASTVEPRMEALINLTVLRDYLCKSVDWRLRPLVLVAKLWAHHHNINNAKNMTISSYSLVLMVIHFLQYAVNPAVLPCLHDMFPDKFTLLRSNDFGFVDMNETMSPYETKNTQTIGELFLSFLEYYSRFDYTQFAISIRTGGLLPINVCRLAKSLKNDIHQWKELCIEEPFDLTNTARSVYDFDTFERVKAVFVASWRILQQTLDLSTIFAPIIIPPTSNVLPTLNAGVQYDGESICSASTVILSRENSINLATNGSTLAISQDTNEKGSIPNGSEQQDKDYEITYNTKKENQPDSLKECIS